MTVFKILAMFFSRLDSRQLPLQWGISTPYALLDLYSTRFGTSNGISIVSAVFAQLTRATNTQTDRETGTWTRRPRYVRHL